MRIALLIFLLLISVVNNCVAIEAKILGDKIGNHLVITKISLPDNLLDTELNSGLPNNISHIIQLYLDDNRVKRFQIDRKIIYDLWDEIYTVETFSSTGITVTKYKNKSTLLMQLKQVNLSSIIQPGLEPVKLRGLRISLQTIYNPVDQVRIKKIKNWIMSSNGYSPSGNFKVALANNGERPSNSKRGLRFQKLFEKIMDDFNPEEGLSGQWQSSVEFITLNWPALE